MIFLRKHLSGFTLIETLVGLTLTGLVASAILVGITQSKLSIIAIDARDRAFEELKVHTEVLIGLASANIDRPGSELEGRDVILIPGSNPEQPVLTGKFYYKFNKSRNSGEYSEYYDIHTWITWESHNRFFLYANEEKAGVEKVEFKLHQIAIN